MEETKEEPEEQIGEQLKQEEIIHPNELPSNHIIIGAIQLSSPFKTMDELSEMLISLLENDHVAWYLELLKPRRSDN